MKLNKLSGLKIKGIHPRGWHDKDRRSAVRIQDSLLFGCRLLRKTEMAKAMLECEEYESESCDVFPPITDHSFPVTVNISATGMAFATEQAFPVGESVAISLQLSITSKPMRIIGRVVDFVEDPEGSTGYVRLSFDVMAQYSRLRLTNYTLSKWKRKPIDSRGLN